MATDKIASLRELLTVAEQAVGGVEDERLRVRLLSRIATFYAEAGQRQDARRLLDDSVKQFIPMVKAETTDPAIFFKNFLCWSDLTEAQLTCTSLPVTQRWIDSQQYASRLYQLLFSKLVEDLRSDDAYSIHTRVKTSDRMGELGLNALGQLATHYYQLGKMREVESILQQATGKTPAVSLFFRNVFAAQAAWKWKQERVVAQSLLQQADYWHQTFLQQAKSEYAKKARTEQWARLQCMAGDLNAARQTLTAIELKEPMAISMQVDDRWYPFEACARELANFSSPEQVREFLAKPFGKTTLTEQAIVLALVAVGKDQEFLKQPAVAEPFWKLAAESIRDETVHHPRTLALVFHRRARQDNGDNWKPRALAATEKFRQIYTTFMKEASPEDVINLRLTYVIDLLEIGQPDAAFEAMNQYVQQINKATDKRSASDSSHYFSELYRNWPQHHREWQQAISKIEDKLVRAEACIYSAQGLHRCGVKPPRGLYSTSY
ncbi:MAG: hypothetical protein U0796_11725 [Gemmatales bacterium]